METGLPTASTLQRTSAGAVGLSTGQGAFGVNGVVSDNNTLNLGNTDSGSIISGLFDMGADESTSLSAASAQINEANIQTSLDAPNDVGGVSVGDVAVGDASTGGVSLAGEETDASGVDQGADTQTNGGDAPAAEGAQNSDTEAAELQAFIDVMLLGVVNFVGFNFSMDFAVWRSVLGRAEQQQRDSQN